MSRLIFIGDVHGCLTELDELVNLLSPKTGDRIFFVGDLVDRGLSSCSALKRESAMRDPSMHDGNKDSDERLRVN